MHTAKLFPASAVLFGYAAAASTCTKDIQITEPTPVINCEVVDAKIEVKPQVAGSLLINGPTQIKGLKIDNATEILSLGSNTINSIEEFTIHSLTNLNTISMDTLRSINKLSMVTLPSLRHLTFGSKGITKASAIEISDTFLNSLNNLNLTTVDTLKINNNKRLTKFDSGLVNITTSLIINDNGHDMEVYLDNLENAAEIQIRNAKAVKVPSLHQLNASLKVDNNDLESFIAPNLTKVANAIAFINNKQLANLSLPVLKASGDLRIVNNTKLTDLDGFPKLTTISGSIKLSGNFDKVKIPELEEVKGAIDVSSTTNSSDFCDFFNNLDVPSANTRCRSNHKASSQGAEDSDVNGDVSDEKDGHHHGASGIVDLNTALMGLVLFAGIAQLL